MPALLPLVLLAVLGLHRGVLVSRARQRRRSPVTYPPLSEQAARSARRVLSLAAWLAGSGLLLLVLALVLGLPSTPGLLLLLAGADLALLLVLARTGSARPVRAGRPPGGPAGPRGACHPDEDPVEAAARDVVAGAEAMLAAADHQPPDSATNR